MDDEQKCPTCGLAVTFNRHQTPWACISAMKLQDRAQVAQIARMETRELELLKELRELGWEERTR